MFLMSLLFVYINVSTAVMARLMMAVFMLFYHMMIVLFDDMVVVIMMRRLDSDMSTIYFYCGTCERAAGCKPENTKSNYRKESHFVAPLS